ncbi:PREDICTED: SET and MYND domain-containing protein 4-like [Ceratosolen solmsi marchali]|uniref:SET and MYND domain-containing protein 4-like n=1 Tax=Ceratosolen solmsi marchali TaxID=326594 RepID=A0AAJ6YQY5_9HYME|nr:PREDICTED: SET and MYND domain-containing protein 4-like [Ceratosolen solmsi marchali]
MLFNKMTLMQRKILSLKFKTADTDELRIIAALNTMKIFQTIPEIKCESKNSKISIALRIEGNRIFISTQSVKELLKVWELYSKSIAKAPNGSEELCLAYANRSALLIKLCKYIECIEDINRALELNYQSHLKIKLLFRKIKCLHLSNDIVKLKDTIEEAKFCLRNINLSCNKKKYEEQLMKVEYFNTKSFSKINVITRVPSYVSHKNIPSASKILTIKFSEKFGRHLVTTCKVDAGEILIMERPYANILMPEAIYTHCSHCLQVYWALIPCEFCIYAMYCSYKCKNEAWKQYHDIECLVTGYLLNIDFNKCKLFSMRLTILALRQAGSIEKLKHIVQNANNYTDPSRKGFDEDGMYCSDKYCSFYSLTTNTEKRSVSDLFDRALDAANILYYLCVYTTLFGKKFDQDINKKIHKFMIAMVATMLL